MLWKPICIVAAIALGLTGPAVVSADSAVVFDFDEAKDVGNGTVENAGGFQPETGESGVPSRLSIVTGRDGSPALAAELRETDGFGVVAGNFTSETLGGSGVPFNQLLERGGTLEGRAVFTKINGNPTAQIFLARMGSTTGFDLTDSDENEDNYNFTGAQSANQPFTFEFKLPRIDGSTQTSNLDDAGGPYYGIGLGIGGEAGDGTVVVFDNLTFTPHPPAEEAEAPAEPE